MRFDTGLLGDDDPSLPRSVRLASGYSSWTDKTEQVQRWIGAKLGISGGIWTVVVCLDDNRSVVKTYNEITHF